MLAEAECQPLLIIWEDLNWADPSTLELLELLLDQAPTSAMLNVLTFRPEFVPTWPMRSHMTTLTLNHLERPQVGLHTTILQALSITYYTHNLYCTLTTRNLLK